MKAEDCPHRTGNKDGTIECAIMARMGRSPIAGPGKANYPCDKCHQGWKDGKNPEKTDRETWPAAFVRQDNVMRLPGTPDQSLGMGDTVAKVLKSLGIEKRKGCGCEKRQAKLNQLVPYD